MSTYQPPTFDAPIDLDLSRNEGRPAITTIDLAPEDVAAATSRYPDTSRLTELVAARHGVGPERVLVTAGSDDALFRCFLRCEGTAVSTTPSFEMIRHYASQTGIRLIEVPWWDGDFPVGELLRENAELVVLVSPNNPTGSVIGESDLRKLADGFPLVVLDAAYAEFGTEDLTPIALELDNVVVLRTMSKAFGLAGLRVGYLLGPAALVEDLRGYGSPFSVSGLSARLVAGVLETGDGPAVEFATRVSTERDGLFDVLEELGARPLPSQANFVLATDVDPGWLVPAAASLGVALRRFPGRANLSTSVRIGLPGDPDSFARLVDTLRAALDPEAILFDMDGVLADVSESFRAAIVTTAAAFGVDVVPGDIAAAKATGNASDDWDLTHRLCLAAGVEVSFEEVRDRFEEVYQGEGDTPGLKKRESLLIDRDLLAGLAGQIPLGIVTARPRKDADDFLERFDVGRYFTTVVTREDAPSKPDPAPVRLALERLGVERAWMLGDTRDDLRAARAAGVVVPIAVAVPGDDPSALSGAARVLDTVNDLKEILNVTNS